MSFLQDRPLAFIALFTVALLSGCANPSQQPIPPTSTIIDEPGVSKELLERQIIIALPDRLRPEWPSITRDLQTQYKLRPIDESPLTSIDVQGLVF